MSPPMRPAECALSCVLLLSTLVSLPGVRVFVAILTLAIPLSRFRIGDTVLNLAGWYRPQLLPLLAAVLALAAREWVLSQWWLSAIFSLVILAGVVTTIALCLVLPLPVYPPLSGGFGSGCTVLEWSDDPNIWSREANTTPAATDDALSPMPCTIRVFYPIDQSTARDAKYSHASVQVGAARARLPYERFIISDFFSKRVFGWLPPLHSYIARQTRCNSLLNAPLATAASSSFAVSTAAEPHRPRFPVVLYSHGQHSLPEKQLALCEELASHGFVVAAVYHRDEDRIGDRFGAIERRQIDFARCIDYLQRLNDASRNELPSFAGRLTFERGVAIIGHSFGGTSVLLSCATRAADKQFLSERSDAAMHEPLRASNQNRPRIVCGVALDPWMFPIYRDLIPTVDRPTLLLNSDLWNESKSTDSEKIIDYCTRTHSVAHRLVFHATRHFNFTDLPIWLNASPVAVRFAGWCDRFWASLRGRTVSPAALSRNRVLLPRRLLCEPGDDYPLLGDADGLRVLRAYKDLTLEFLRRHFHATASTARAAATVESLSSDPSVTALFSAYTYGAAQSDAKQNN